MTDFGPEAASLRVKNNKMPKDCFKTFYFQSIKSFFFYDCLFIILVSDLFTPSLVCTSPYAAVNPVIPPPSGLIKDYPIFCRVYKIAGEIEKSSIVKISFKSV